MKYIASKVEAGVIDLSKIPTHTLIQMAMETTSDRDRDCLGCEIMYRRKEPDNG